MNAFTFQGHPLLAIIEITLFATEVIRGVVQANSTIVTLTIDDSNNDGAIDRTEWARYTGRTFGHLAGDTSPPMLFAATTGQTTTGTLYAPVAHSAGENISTTLSQLAHNGYAPQVSGLNICYLAGTLVLTPSGEVPVETLRAGDLVMTLDHGALPLVWTSASHVTPADLDLAPNKRPVRIATGALGNGLPRRDVDVSPQHRVMVTLGDGAEYLISARHLMMSGHPGVALRPLGGEFDLIHIAFAGHQIVMAEGAPMESFFTGPLAVRALPLPQRLGLIATFPEVAGGQNPMSPARPFIRHRDLAAMRLAAWPGMVAAGPARA